MFLEQYELPLFVLPKRSSGQALGEAARGQTSTEKVYCTTSRVVQLLKLRNASSLYQARNNGSAYRNDRYIAVPAGHNRWEVFRRCST
jgi:hypothetical protein